VRLFIGVKVHESSWERVITMGDTNTVMEVNKEGRENTKPELARNGRVKIAGPSGKTSCASEQ